MTFEVNGPQLTAVVKLAEPNASLRIVLEGDLSDEQRERLLQIANACPVHKILTNPIGVRTGLAIA